MTKISMVIKMLFFIYVFSFTKHFDNVNFRELQCSASSDKIEERHDGQLWHDYGSTNGQEFSLQIYTKNLNKQNIMVSNEPFLAVSFFFILF